MKRKRQLDFFDSPPKRPGKGQARAVGTPSYVPKITPAERRAYQARRLAHGGESSRGSRKLKRPFDRRRPLHLVLRSKVAKGSLSLRAGQRRLEIDRLIKREARRNHVTLHRAANVGNHIHIFATFADHAGFKKFLRTIAGLIARLATGARKGKPFGRKFWEHLAFSRIVTGRKGHRAADQYVEANQIEAAFGRWERALFEDAPARYRQELDELTTAIEVLQEAGP